MLGERKKKRRLLTEGPVTGSKTNFDLYLKEQLKDPGFSEQFEEAGEPWDIALQWTLVQEVTGHGLLISKVKGTSE